MSRDSRRRCLACASYRTMTENEMRRWYEVPTVPYEIPADDPNAGLLTGSPYERGQCTLNPAWLTVPPDHYCSHFRAGGDP